MISDKKLNLYVLLGLILFAVAIRFPWFYLDTINWDESVYILVGQSLADGHLPYTQIWENKPPLAFLFYAICEYLVPNSLAFIRFSGAVLIGVTGWIVAMVTHNIAPKSASILAGVLSVFSATFLVPHAQCILLEHIAIAPVMLAIYLLCKTTAPKSSNALFIGALFGIAILIRSNLILVPIIIIPISLLALRVNKIEFTRFIAFASSGALLILILVFLPYLLLGHANAFYLTLIKVPLAYVSGVSDPLLKVVSDLVRNIFLEHEELGAIKKLVHLFRYLFWGIGSAGFVLIAYSSIKNKNFVLTVIFLANISLFASIIAGKHASEHYLLQIAPIFCINIAYFLRFVNINVIKYIKYSIIFSSIFIAINLPGKSYYSIFLSHINGNSPYYGYSFNIADYINKNSKSEDTLFLTHYALTYWLTKSIPLVSTVILPFGMLDDNAMVKAYYGQEFTTADIFNMVLEKKPTRIVVIRSQLGFTQGFYPRLKEYLDKYYDIESTPNNTPGTYIIFLRKK